jgi:hypothetical protein
MRGPTGNHRICAHTNLPLGDTADLDSHDHGGLGASGRLDEMTCGLRNW